MHTTTIAGKALKGGSGEIRTEHGARTKTWDLFTLDMQAIAGGHQITEASTGKMRQKNGKWPDITGRRHGEEVS